MEPNNERRTEKWLKLLHTIPDQPVGSHFTEDEFVAYSMERLDAADVERLDRHLETCPECSNRLMYLYEVAEAWSGPGGEQRLERLGRRVRQAATRDLLVDYLKGVFSPIWRRDTAVALADAPPPDSQFGKIDEAGTLAWFEHYDAAGNLEIGIGSKILDEGVTIRFRAGDWKRELVLERVDGDEVGGDIRISAAELATILMKHQSFEVEIVTDDFKDEDTSRNEANGAS